MDNPVVQDVGPQLYEKLFAELTRIPIHEATKAEMLKIFASELSLDVIKVITAYDRLIDIGLLGQDVDGIVRPQTKTVNFVRSVAEDSSHFFKRHVFDGCLDHPFADEIEAHLKAAKPGYVYIMSSSKGVHKIGMSTTPHARLKDVQDKIIPKIGHPGKVDLLFYFQTVDMRTAEKQLHSVYDAKRVDSSCEWFYLDPTDVEYLWTITEFVPGHGFKRQGFDREAFEAQLKEARGEGPIVAALEDSAPDGEDYDSMTIQEVVKRLKDKYYRYWAYVSLDLNNEVTPGALSYYATKGVKKTSPRKTQAMKSLLRDLDSGVRTPTNTTPRTPITEVLKDMVDRHGLSEVSDKLGIARHKVSNYHLGIDPDEEDNQLILDYYQEHYKQ